MNLQKCGPLTEKLPTATPSLKRQLSGRKDRAVWPKVSSELEGTVSLLLRVAELLVVRETRRLPASPMFKQGQALKQASLICL